MKNLFWILIASVGFSLPARAEYDTHSTSLPGQSRSLTGPAAKALGSTANACQIGRSATPSRKPAIQPKIPTNPVVPKPGPFARENPRLQPDFPGEEKYQTCLEGIPILDFFACPQVLTTCQAGTVDGGKTKIRPLVLDAGNQCTAGTEIYEMACGRGLEFKRFKNDVKCAATQFPQAGAE